MEDLFILGAGGLAREVYLLVDDINRDRPRYKFRGFIDSKKENPAVRIGKMELPVIQEDNFAKLGKSAGILAIGIGDPKVLTILHEKFRSFDFANLIHPNFVGHADSISWGAGNVVTAGCIFTVDIRVGSLNFFNLNSTVGHDAVIGSCNVFNPGANISGGVEVGDGNLVGTNASILQYIKMGSGSVLGANALLTKNLGDNIVAVGVPAKPLNGNK